MLTTAILGATLAAALIAGPGAPALEPVTVLNPDPVESQPIPGGGPGAGAAANIGVGIDADLTAEVEGLDADAGIETRLTPAQRAEIAARCEAVLANPDGYSADAVAICSAEAGAD